MGRSSERQGRTIAIGDIHGCATALRTLLEAIQPTPDDHLITLGDYVDRGPASRTVLDLLVELVDRCTLIPLLGNHEILFLDSLSNADAFDFWLHCGGDSTLASYGGTLDNLPPAHLVFLRGLQRFHETESHLFVHANYEANRPLAETSETMLYWEHVTSHLPGRHFSGKTVVVGHTPQPNGQVLDVGYLLCIDTYCFGGGWLTALDVVTNRLWQANEAGDLRESRLSGERGT